MDATAFRGLVRGLLAGVILVAGTLYVLSAATTVGLRQAFSTTPDVLPSTVAPALLLLLLITTAVLVWAVLYKRRWWSLPFLIWLVLFIAVETTIPVSGEGAGLLTDPSLLPGTLGCIFGLAAVLNWTTRREHTFDTGTTRSPPL